MKLPFKIVFKKPEMSGSNYTNGKGGTARRKTYIGKPKDNHKDLAPYIRSEQVENSRGLEHNSGLIAQISSDFRHFAVGEKGFQPRMDTEDATFDRAAVDYFNDWARSASVCGRFNLTELCMQIAGTLPIDGEIFALRTRRGDRPAVQLIETHNITTMSRPQERIIDGVQLGLWNQPLAYGVIQADRSIRWIKAGAISHIYNPYRPSSVRYAPFIQHSIDDMLDEREVIESEIQVVKDNQRLSMVLKSNERGALDDEETGFNFGKPTETDTEVTAEDAAKALNARVIQIGENQELKEHESKRPSPTFVGLLEHLRRDALNGILPYEFAINPAGIGGAAMRLVVGKGNRIFSWHSQIIINRFLNAVWFFVIGDAIDRGLLPPVKGWHRVKFSTPKKLTVDFGRDEAQNRQNIEAGLKTYDEDYEERGLDADEEFELRAWRARDILRLTGRQDWKTCEIPLWMLVKPSGTSLSSELENLMQKEENS